MNATNQPFWKDDPEVSFGRLPLKRASKPYFAYFIIAIRIFILVIVAALLYRIPILLLAWLVLFGFPLGIRILLLRKIKDDVQGTGEIQARAREKVGASYIGSAIHVAGHPLLQRDQQVVLAIVGDQLNIYSYENSIPLDTILLKDIQAVHTVSYDDERVPHIEVIDSVAQALQLTFLWQEQLCTCLFRRMRRLKSIDWFHAIQQTRLQRGLAKDSPLDTSPPQA